MGDVLAQLEDAIRLKPSKDKITAGEELVLQTCKARAIRDFTVGACLSSAVAWAVFCHHAASRSLTYGQRLNISVGSAILTGMWRFDRSLNACLDHILGLQGTRMQRELANIILTKHQDNASRVKLVRKHFYQEQVFDDVNPDRPISRWRSRNSYTDRTSIQRTGHTNDNSHHEKSEGQHKLPTRNPGGDVIADPLDCIFGSAEISKEMTHSDKGTMPRRRLRKKAHRRRAHNTETFGDQ